MLPHLVHTPEYSKKIFAESEVRNLLSTLELRSRDSVGHQHRRIHLVLNGSLTDDTPVKWAQVKTFLCFIQFC